MTKNQLCDCACNTNRVSIPIPLSRIVSDTNVCTKDVEISKISLHTLNQNGSWIYLPASIEVSFISYIDTTIITRHSPIETITQNIADENNVQIIKLTELKTCRYIRLVAKNYGIIPSGKPGAGNTAWLFVDEIEVE